MTLERHLFPANSEYDATVELDEELAIITGGRRTAIRESSDGFQLTAGDTERDITADVVGETAATTGLSADVVSALTERWLVLRHGGPRSTVLWRRLGAHLPGLARLQAEYPNLEVRTRFSHREVGYLRCTDPRAAATSYWQEPCGSAAGRALLDGALIRHGTSVTLSESRIGLLHLIGDPALRRELAHASAVHPIVIVPALASRSVTAELRPRAQVDFTKTALKLPESRQAIHAAYRLGMTATGASGIAAYHELAFRVRQAGFPRRGTRLVDRLARQSIAGRQVRVIETAAATRTIGRRAKNCLNAEHFGWPGRVERGAVQLAIFERNGEVDAILALSAAGDQELDFRAPSNRPVPRDLHEATQRRVAELTSGELTLRPQESHEPF